MVVLYKVSQGRDLRYTYARPRIRHTWWSTCIRGARRRRPGPGIYEPASAAESEAAPPGAPVPTGTNRAANPAEPAGAAPASADRPQAQALDQRPDAPLIGLKALGVVVEELGSQATACGLDHGALETAVTKRLSDAGFSVRRNSDEDTYVYVNIITASVSTGLCVSRYDVFLNTNTTATLSYRDGRYLVEVSLLRKGGIAGGPPAAHGQAVQRGLLGTWTRSSPD